ncbi:type II toxin-antitoxin system HicA family toxin [Brevundimonas sp.]|jgi:predicted RNA binding protein YcfA (HicA-like mRNA interferase family)|uniref:type II toxin-antitoxin system HicA family toxin n=1 Tax=Brevundimonas sp. TaxID=1871086 RepID=UPI002E1264DC|nr:type II toxin-antitoxin system HicA family toxin [Brevundimonas sp.]
MPNHFYRELTKLLASAEFERVPGGKGSHEKWRNRMTGIQVTVPSKPLRHIANEILKQAGLPKAF